MWDGTRAFHRRYAAINPSDVPFAEDAFGDQWLLRSGHVIRLSSETGDLAEPGLSFWEFLGSVERDPIETLLLAPLMRFQVDGGRLEPGQLLNAYPPFCTQEAAAGVHLKAVPAWEQLEFLAHMESVIEQLRDGQPFAVIVTPRDHEHTDYDRFGHEAIIGGRRRCSGSRRSTFSLWRWGNVFRRTRSRLGRTRSRRRSGSSVTSTTTRRLRSAASPACLAGIDSGRVHTSTSATASTCSSTGSVREQDEHQDLLLALLVDVCRHGRLSPTSSEGTTPGPKIAAARQSVARLRAVVQPYERALMERHADQSASTRPARSPKSAGPPASG